MLEYLSFNEQVGAVANGKGLRYIVVRDEDSDVFVLKPCHDSLNVLHRNGIDTGKGFIEKNELWIHRESPGNFSSPAFSTTQHITVTLPHMRQSEFRNERFKLFLLFPLGKFSHLKYGQDVILNAELAKY